MFNYFKLKKMKLQYEVLLLGKLNNITKVADSIPEILEIVEKLKDVDQKDIVSKLAEVIHEKNETKDGDK